METIPRPSIDIAVVMLVLQSIKLQCLIGVVSNNCLLTKYSSAVLLVNGDTFTLAAVAIRKALSNRGVDRAAAFAAKSYTLMSEHGI